MMKNKVFCTEEEFEARFNELVKTETYFISGTNSMYVPSLLTSFIDKSVCRHWPNLDGEMELMTPGEAARTELKREFPNIHLRAHKNDFSMLDIPAPIYYDGKRRNCELCYIDLAGAYWQIYRPMSLDVAWPRGIGTLELHGVADVLRGWKPARNAIVGISRSYRITGIKGIMASERHLDNPFFNPSLWRHVQSILHQVAWTARSIGACYIATDGYIFTKRKAADYFATYLDDHFLDYRRLDGEGYIHAFGSYKVGAKQTMPYHLINSKQNNLCKEEGTLEWWTRLKSGELEL